MSNPGRIVVLGLCGLCLVLGLWLGGRSIIEARNAGAALSTEPQSPPSASVQKKPSLVEHKAVRRILRGEGGSAVVSSDLERLPPRAPLGQSSVKPAMKQAAKDAESKPAATPVDPTERKKTILYQPVAEAAGVLDASGYHITLAGLDPVARDETCHRLDGGSWPCGLMACTAFRAWLRGRALTCDVPATKGPVTVSCTVGDDDPALWLAENGWAGSDGARYREAVNKAKEEKKGIFGDPPKAYSSIPVLASPPPPRDTDGSGEAPE
ncbi:MAG: thermonuclease family protein [Rhizobiaceae bacterium]|nr:MAG: thermonuclease family protein [Rhizobiaceae bacterium]